MYVVLKNQFLKTVFRFKINHEALSDKKFYVKTMNLELFRTVDTRFTLTPTNVTWVMLTCDWTIDSDVSRHLMSSTSVILMTFIMTSLT